MVSGTCALLSKMRIVVLVLLLFVGGCFAELQKPPLELDWLNTQTGCMSACFSNPSKPGWKCSCQASARNEEEKPEGSTGYSRVRLVIQLDLCWYQNVANYKTCSKKRNSETHTDYIHICAADDIDVAQAYCQSKKVGDARWAREFQPDPNADEEDPSVGSKNDQRWLIADMHCTKYAKGIHQCFLQYPKETTTTCKEMQANCYRSSCYQDTNVIKADSYMGTIYGQKCSKSSTDAHGAICTINCFQCPPSYGDKYDGDKCFATTGHNFEGYLTYEPHFRTLDGKHYDFQGQCSYYLMKHSSFSVIATFRICGTKSVTCTSEITISTGHTVIRLGQGNDTSITYKGIKQSPRKPFHNKDVNYYLASSEYDAVDVWDGFKILWDRVAEYRVVIPPWNVASMEGLLGNIDGKKENDMTMPNRVRENDPVKFGDSWLVPGSCPPGVSPHAPQNPTLTASEKTLADRRGCRFIRQNFQNCSSQKALEEKDAQYNNCLLDVATCNRDLSTCLCSSFETLADFCEKNEEGVGDWRARMPDPLCKPKCNRDNRDAGEVYRLDADPCTQTCDAIKFVREKKFDCISMKMAGCNCEEGKARNADGKCIDKDLCPM